MWALTLGSVLTLTTGAVAITGMTTAPAPVQTQALQTDAGLAMDSGPTVSTEAWPAITEGVCRECPPDDPGNVTIAVGVRWGYLDDPAVAVLEGGWRFNDTRTGGTFAGRWHLVFGRAGGFLRGEFSLPRDGKGTFRGQWNVSGARFGGALSGAWVRVNDTHGYFEGQWTLPGGRLTGALAGRWTRLTDAGGALRGEMVAAPSIAPVDWDGYFHATAGTVRVLRTVRFERDDHVLPPTDRATVGWDSTTTVNWDGLILILRFPKGEPGPNVTLHTDPASFEWTARELAGLHVRERVDRAGHEIEVFGVVLRPRPPPPDVARFGIQLRWGNLSSRDGTDAPARDWAVWDGFAQITYGGLVVERVLSFERGDSLLPPDNRVTVSWHSATTTGWDGLAFGALVPLRALGDTYFTLHAGRFTHVFPMADLLGDHVFDAGNGNKIEVHAVRL